MAGTVLITGGNGVLALGFVAAMLSLYPEYTLLITVRNTSPTKDPNTAKLLRIISSHPGARTIIRKLDLARLSDVRQFAEDLKSQISTGEVPRLSAIVCNAMTWSLEAGQKFTPDGLETTFQICHLSHYALILSLLGSMDSSGGRVVMVGSPVHYPERANPLSKYRCGFPDLDKFDELVKPKPDEKGDEHDRGYARYGTAKLANYTFMHDLNRRLELVSSTKPPF
jgi:WW domain-containing oxidoreductase